MIVLSIQPWVVQGLVDTGASMVCLHALGHEVWGVPTGIFSNPDGPGGSSGRVMPAEQVAELLAGVVARGRLAECAAVLSGNLGAAETGGVVLDAVERVKTANPRALYACDPEIGIGGRIYVQPGIPEFLRDRALGRADILTPNAFELSVLAGVTPGSLSEAAAAAGELRAKLRPGGPRMVLVAGLDLAFLPQQTATLLVHEKGAAAVATPRVASAPPGTGDALVALFLGRLLDGTPAEAALSHAASAVHALTERAAADATADLPLVAARTLLLEPPLLWPAEAVA
jgi:pyridoxine kinase